MEDSKIVTNVAIYNGVGKGISFEKRDLYVNKKNVLIKVESSMFGKALQRALVQGHPHIKPNSVLGTLFSGIVVNENIHMKIGSHVVVNPHKSCKICLNCMNERTNLCSTNTAINPGGISEYVLIEEDDVDSIFSFEDSICFDEAVLTEIVACVIESIDKANVKKNDKILIAGSGVTAFIHAQILKNMGVSCVHGLYKNQSRRKIYEKIGITPICNEWDNEEIVLNAKKYNSFFDGYNVIFEVVGSKSVIEKCIDLVAPKGKLILFGGYPINEEVSLPLNYIHYNEINIIGTYHYSQGLFEKALNYIREKKVQLDMLITNRIMFDELSNISGTFNSEDCITLLVKY